MLLKTIYITRIDDLLVEWCDEPDKNFIVNAVAVENDSESTFLYVFNLSGLVFSKASVPRWTRILVMDFW